MSWEKTEFDHTLITSQFLNDLQDYIMSLEERIAELEARPQLVPFREERFTQIPQREGDTATLTLQSVLIDREVVAGDVFVGTDYAALGVVTSTDGQFAEVSGLGERLGTES